MNDLIERLRKRAEIRRQIPGRKSVQAGEPDRIADLLEEAATEIIKVASTALHHHDNSDKYQDLYHEEKARFKEVVKLSEASFQAMKRKAEKAESRIKTLEAIMSEAITVINDWGRTYASEWYEPHHVEETHKRISGNGGTINYISVMMQKMREAIAESGEKI